jgi:hypothetical protein
MADILNLTFTGNTACMRKLTSTEMGQLRIRFMPARICDERSFFTRIKAVLFQPATNLPG